MSVDRAASALTLAAVLVGCAQAPAPQVPPGSAGGTVFLDANRNGLRDPGERGIPNVAVSNGKQVVRSDRRGSYQLPVGDDTILFVVQPRGHQVPVDANGLPRFYYVHKPAGSPTDLRFPGVAPTGPLPARIDFPLLPSPVGDRFSALLFGDTQVRDLGEVEHLARDVVSPLVDTDAAFGILLGDLVYDELDVLEPLTRVVGRIRVPWWSVIGNHDINFRARDDADSDETWTRLFGPTRYAFQVGRVHFVVLDSDVYQGWNEAQDTRGGYLEGFDEDELAFVEQYLAQVERDELVVVAMHVPLGLPEGRRSHGSERLLALLSQHPHTLSLSAHSHRQFQLFLGPEDGFSGPRPHHHLNVGATSGSWWLGDLDEDGIPHATQRDGAPNGYWIAHFDGPDYRLAFRAARRPADHQINVIAPFRVAASESARTEILANVFAGSERTRVELQVDAGSWRPMQRVPMRDPRFEILFQKENENPPRDRRRLRAPGLSSHIWSALLPADLAPGSHVVRIRATDPYIGSVSGRHILDVVR